MVRMTVYPCTRHRPVHMDTAKPHILTVPDRREPIEDRDCVWYTEELLSQVCAGKVRL